MPSEGNPLQVLSGLQWGWDSSVSDTLSVLDSAMLGTVALNPLNGELWTQPGFIVKRPHKLLIDLTGLDPNPGSVD